jgi:hypothetical protein
MITMSVLSTQYLQIPVAATLDGASYDPTGDTVSFAFTTIGASPGPGDWNGGAWITSNGYLAQILIGPRNYGVALPVGAYQIWVWIGDSPEVPVQQADLLRIV